MMKQEDLFRKLGVILEELNEQYRFLAQNPLQLNELELELFQANANFLADHVQIIKKINSSQNLNDQTMPIGKSSYGRGSEIHEEFSSLESENSHHTAPINDPLIDDETVEPFVEEPEIEEIQNEIFRLDQSPSTFEFILNDHAEHETQDSPEMGIDEFERDNSSIADDEAEENERFEFEEKSVDELFNRPLSEEEERILAEKKNLQQSSPPEEFADQDDDEIGPEPFLITRAEAFPIEKEDLTLEAAPISETKVNTTEPVEDPTYKPTLNDILAKRANGNINSNTGATITDLKQGINLNDKLLYIKDLFNGYNLAYAEAIDLANKLPNFEAADNFFKKNYAQKNNWAEKQATVDKFYELLNQRFRS